MGDVRKTREMSLFSSAHADSRNPRPVAGSKSEQEFETKQRTLQERLSGLKEEWERQQTIYLRLETKSHELSSIYRGMAARLEDMQLAAQQQQQDDAEQPRRMFEQTEIEATEQRRAKAAALLAEEQAVQASKWKALVQAIQTENELKLESMVLKHKEAVNKCMHAVTEHVTAQYKTTLRERSFKAEQALSRAEHMQEQASHLDRILEDQSSRKSQLQESVRKIEELQALRSRIRELWRLNRTPRRQVRPDLVVAALVVAPLTKLIANNSCPLGPAIPRCCLPSHTCHGGCDPRSQHHAWHVGIDKRRRWQEGSGQAKRSQAWRCRIQAGFLARSSAEADPAAEIVQRGPETATS